MRQLISTMGASRWTWILLSSVFLFGGLPWILERLRWTSSLADGIYIGTGVAVVWYTIETYYLRREGVRPLIISRIEQWDSGTGESRDVLVLRNIGRAPALFVQVADIQFKEKELRVEFATVDIIEEKHGQEANSQPYFGDAKVLDTFLPNLDPRYANRTHQITITYEDVNGGRHKSVMQMGKAGTRLLSHT
jgi:hypothetical protein